MILENVKFDISEKIWIIFRGWRLHLSLSFLMVELKRSWQYWHSCIAENLWKTLFCLLSSYLLGDRKGSWKLETSVTSHTYRSSVTHFSLALYCHSRLSVVHLPNLAVVYFLQVLKNVKSKTFENGVVKKSNNMSLGKTT